ncbi:MAG: tetratricopeptide repeat protein [Bdellovibrionota bacterium]
MSSLNDDERFEVLKESGNCYFRLGRETEAREAYLGAMKVRPDSVLLEVNLGMVELQCHRLDEAEKHFQRALELDSGCSKGYSGLALVAQEREDFFVAEKYFTKRSIWILSTKQRFCSLWHGLTVAASLPRFRNVSSNLFPRNLTMST